MSSFPSRVIARAWGGPNIHVPQYLSFEHGPLRGVEDVFNTSRPCFEGVDTGYRDDGVPLCTVYVERQWECPTI